MSASSRARLVVFTAGAALFTLVVIVGALCLGAQPVAPLRVLEILGTRWGIDPAALEPTETIVRLRLPRVLLGGLVGWSLAVCGAVMQGVFRNPLADPYLLGVSSGGTAGAACVIALVGDSPGLLLSAGAFAGGLLAVAAVYRLGVVRPGRLSDHSLILAGIAVATLFGAVTSFLLYMARPDELRRIIFWMLGSLAGQTLRDPRLAVLGVAVVAGALAIQGFARDLNALVLGDDMATHLGVDPQTARKVLLVLVTALTTAAVSLAGIIGFVGLVVPHIVRLVLGPEHRRLLPACGLVGALFLIACDAAARSVAPPRDIPVGVVTALIGAPVLVVLVRRPRRSLQGSGADGGAA